MLASTITALKEYILSNNTYFNTGYSDVYMDAVNGKVIGKDAAGNPIAVFPADHLGAYFYLRVADEMKPDSSPTYSTDDCGLNLGISVKVWLVACMQGADPDELLNNLVNTIQAFDENVRFSGFVCKKENVIMQELKLRSKEEIEKALQIVGKDYTIVSANFDISKIFEKKKLDCIENPCTPC